MVREVVAGVATLAALFAGVYQVLALALRSRSGLYDAYGLAAYRTGSKRIGACSVDQWLPLRTNIAVFPRCKAGRLNSAAKPSMD